MNSEVDYKALEKLSERIKNLKKIFGTTMIVLCIIGVLMATVAFILLIYGIVNENKWCEIVGIVLNFVNIFTLGVSFVKMMIRVNIYLKQ